MTTVTDDGERGTHKHEWQKIGDDPLTTRHRCGTCGDIAMYLCGRWVNLTVFVDDSP